MDKENVAYIEIHVHTHSHTHAHIHYMGYYSTLLRIESLSYGTTYKILEVTMLGEIRKSEKGKHYMI